ncbi:MerR family transcriptional regulator [Actinomyces sp. zg-332]|uniref:MerR family transcriptional regulator n=1 Tax=Actinomyces sp. zg-332 TaxID=2708340 RepID=UPI00141EB5CD|nr:MerR family transcriptional regulator [Actinomyces sp. zg-332]QPK93629.1 MerR family transcriptional regulator [Actinomyces sp. zg-332]
MRTVNEISKLTGVSIRTLQYYDKINLLSPSKYSKAGYRLYNDTDLELLQQILLFRELEFSLKDIRRIINSSNFDKEKALEQQIKLLSLKREHINNLIALARDIKTKGIRKMDFTAFDTKKIDEYTAKAKEIWGETSQYKEFEKKDKKRTPDERKRINQGLMNIFIEFGEKKNKSKDSDEIQLLVKKLHNYICENYYSCSKQIFAELGKAYGNGSEFTKNINATAGTGVAEFVSSAIETYCE